MKNKEDVLIIIVTWNSEDKIKACLESLKKININHKTVVVDNASNDQTREIVKVYKEVQLLENKENLGYGWAVNKSLRNNSAKFVLLLNPDTEVKKGALEALIKCLEDYPDAGVVGPKLLNPDGRIQKEMSRFPSYLSQVLILLRLHRLPIFSQLSYPDCDYDKTQEADHLMGSALLIRSEVFEKVGLFDENFFLWFEDTDLLKRIKNQGYKIMYCPKGEVMHSISSSIKKLPPLRRQTIWNKSLRYYFKKHGNFLEQWFLEPFIYLSFIPAFLLSLKRQSHK